jgi:hypothetical protein
MSTWIEALKDKYVGTSTANLTATKYLAGHYVFVCFFLIRIVGGWSPNWVHSARRPLNGLLYPPRVIMMMKNLVE